MISSIMLYVYHSSKIRSTYTINLILVFFVYVSLPVVGSANKLTVSKVVLEFNES